MKRPKQVQRFVGFFEEFRRQGWESCLVLERPPEEPSWIEQLEATGAKLVYLARPRGNFDWQAARATYRLCREFAPDVFHCDNIHTSPLIGATLARVPLRLWSKRSMNTFYEECRKPTLREYVAPSYRASGLLAHQILAVSASVADQLIGLKFPRGKVRVFINGFSDYAFSLIDRDEARAGFGFEPQHKVLVTVGHAVPVKGWDLLLRAFSRLVADHPDLRLLIVGDIEGRAEGPYFAKLQALITEFGIGDRVRFTGHLTDISRPLSAGDLFVFPSRSEGFANALLEGVAAGLPAVATDVGGAREVVRPGDNGFIVPRQDVPALAEAIDRLLADPELLARFRAQARLPDEIPTWEEYAKRLAAVYAGG